MTINVIDLFAGPGGLGEGFSAFRSKREFPFRIRMSVEMEPSAHRTLTTRAMFRALKREHDINSYRDYVDGLISFDDLCERHPELWKEVNEETLGGPHALGKDNALIHSRLKTLKKKHQGPWVVIGGPPCQAYSLVGRARNKGIKNYRPEKDKRHFLYAEYLKVLAHIEPDVFVMENVKGILTASVKKKRIFETILDDLHCPGARHKGKSQRNAARYTIHSFVVPFQTDLAGKSMLDPKDFIIRAEDYGIPQARHRVILLGVKNGLGKPSQLKPIASHVALKPLIDDLPKLRSKLSKEPDSADAWLQAITDGTADLCKALAKNGERELAKRLRENARKLPATRPTVSDAYNSGKQKLSTKLPVELRRWISADSPRTLLNHEARGHIRADLLRYFFASSWSSIKGKISPKASDFPASLRPKHANWESGDFADRFRVQLANRPATTITSHISKDGHYFIHYDPLQCRSLTVREAARVQTFPDNYFFEGNRTQQYVQVGNAVPPLLANKLSQIVFKLLQSQ